MVLYNCILDINEYLLANGGCEQVCLNTIGNYNCSCVSGYSLENNFFCSGMLDHQQWPITLSCPLYADINECALGISGCTDVCTNIVGSYYCTCQTGYELTNDNHTCTGQFII